MIKIRLARKGAKNNPFYHIVAIDKQVKRGGKPLDVIGYWHPGGPKTSGKKHLGLHIDKNKLDFWISKGARLTLAVNKLLPKS